MEKQKNGIKQILICVSFLLILAMLLITLSYIFAPKSYWKALRYGQKPIVNSVLNEPDDSIDVLFLGDSLAYSAISPMEIWRKQGFTSFVCAGPAQPMSSCEELLREALEKQRPKVVVFEPNSLYRKKKADAGLDACLESLLPIFTYHDQWKKIDKTLFSGYFNVKETDDFKGFKYKNNAKSGKTSKYMKKTGKIKKMPDFNEEYFKSIVDMCREAGTELIMVSIPSRKCWNYEKHNGVQALSEEYGVEYIDLNLMNDVVSIDWDTDTRDKGDHLNYSGAVKISGFFGEFLKARYSLPDRRNDSDYTQWNEAFDRYLNFVGALEKAL